MIVSKKEETGKEAAISRNYFIYSMANAQASDLLRIKREHWTIENNLHWILDVMFREDDARARIENAAEIYLYLENLTSFQSRYPDVRQESPYYKSYCPSMYIC